MIQCFRISSSVWAIETGKLLRSNFHVFLMPAPQQLSIPVPGNRFGSNMDYK
ncbi:hypothetical protein IQ272_28365 [Chroococcidiopsidales cyanobacterium LEGE 13417]|nr:hypothetical protein [Chroococcidiopsidales cyanobacterium LEGE 13417]